MRRASVCSCELDAAKQGGVRVLKVVHGWGSSGEGGVLGPAIRRSLRLRVKEGRARLVVPGNGSRPTRWKVGNYPPDILPCAVTPTATAGIRASRWSSCWGEWSYRFGEGAVQPTGWVQACLNSCSGPGTAGVPED